jgi:hypothetical protein
LRFGYEDNSPRRLRKISLEPSYRYLLGNPIHIFLQKARGYVDEFTNYKRNNNNAIKKILLC